MQESSAQDVSEEITPQLNIFIAVMFSQIVRNWHKGGRKQWISDNLEAQMIRLNISIQELRTALAYGIDVDDKAADVANWAFIISDNFKNNPSLRGIPKESSFTGD